MFMDELSLLEINFKLHSIEILTVKTGNITSSLFFIQLRGVKDFEILYYELIRELFYLVKEKVNEIFREQKKNSKRYNKDNVR